MGVSACFPTELCYYRRLILCINKTSLCFVLSNISVSSRKINERERGFRLKVFISALLFHTYDKYRHICYSVNRHNQTFSLKNHQHLCLFIYVCVHFVFVPAVLTKFLFIFFHYLFVLFCPLFSGGTRQQGLLRHCCACRKVAGFILDGNSGIFRWLNPSGRSMVLGSTQPLTEMSTTDFLGG